jgi:ribosomal-protein-alanine N-acetyltransferase
MDYIGLAYIVEPMQLEDIPEVLEIEQVAFPTPWPAHAYRHEVGRNRLAYYFVARPQFVENPEEEAEEENPSLLQRVQQWASSTKTSNRPVLWYCGFWIAADEAHISTIAVAPSSREKGIGQLLLATAIERAIELGANIMSLEVRVSNIAAQNLYRKYGFKVVGCRRRYYSDNREDALIMTAEHVASAPYQRMFQRLRAQLIQRLRQVPQATPEKRPHESVPASEFSTDDTERSRPE